jgi:hypothetical protein
MSGDSEPRTEAEVRRAGLAWHADPDDRPGDPACLLRRVCPACGTVAGTDPPVTCQQCGTEIPGT